MVRNFMQKDCPRCGHPRMGPHLANGCGMTSEMVAALKEFKRAHGNRWKSILREMWLQGKDDGLLRQVRNVVGPGGRRLEKIEKTLKL